jgi:hypothetical protein
MKINELVDYALDIVHPSGWSRFLRISIYLSSVVSKRDA